MNKIPLLERFAAQSLVDNDGELIFSKELFAQLIVQECTMICAGIAALRAGDNDVDGRDTADLCGDMIREYFGVNDE